MAHGSLRDLRDRNQRCDCSHCRDTRAFLEFRDLVAVPARPASISTRGDAAAVLLWVAHELVCQIDRVEEADDQADAGPAARVATTAAVKAAAALEAELSRRQAVRDEAEDIRWAQEVGNDELILLARRFSRSWDRTGPPPVVPTSPEDIEVLVEQMTELAKSLFTLASAVESAEEAESAGELRPQRASGSRPRPAGHQAQGGGNGAGKGKKLSRTEAARAKAEADAAVRQALLPQAPVVLEQQENVIQIGTVVRYDSRSMSGLVRVDGVELPFPTSAMIKSGIVTLSPGQEIECKIVRQGSMMTITEVALSVGARAARLNELEKQAKAAEQSYQIWNQRRPR